MISSRKAATLERVTFKTSRLAEFCGEKELTAQTGHTAEDWPFVILKELVDNALDAAEEAQIAPAIKIEVSTERGEIIVADNGPGIPAETIEGVLDYTSRVSSREAYVSPTRGAQGNALKTIIAMPFALDGARGVTMIESRGVVHRIVFEMDPVRREPKVLREISQSDVQNGTRITVHWPKSACSVLEDAGGRFVQMAGDFTTFNPHLSLTCHWDGKRHVNMPEATNPNWRKWRACDPTSAHWYDVDRFGRYMAAHIARDEGQGRVGRTVREFIREFRGLARSDKQKLVLAEAQASGVSLQRFFAQGGEAILPLLAACKNHTKTVDPIDLGLIGADHLLDDCLSLGAAEESFKYKRHLGISDGLPYVIEAAFAYCPDRKTRRLVTGVNFSVGIRNPFRQLGFAEDLSSLLNARWAGVDEPIVFVLHYTCPRVDYTDRGKSAISLPWQVSQVVKELVEKVTRDWHAQRRREEKEATRRHERHDRLVSAKRVSIKDAAWRVMEQAYLQASDGGKLPANARQIMYAARPSILKITGKDTLNDEYFTQTLLVDYVNEHPDRCANWDIVWDARGMFTEPHTGRMIPLGTLEVRRYLDQRPSLAPIANVEFDRDFPTAGPENRFETIQFVEKEGFDSLMSAARIAERFDIAIMSTKGLSVTASRLLIDKLAHRVKRVLVLHDFDVSGFSIFGTLGTSGRRYTFENAAPLIDIGLRLSDVQSMGLESEPVTVSGDWAKRAATLRRHGATEGEIAFLRNRRVELNAMTSRQLVDFIEAKFAEHGVAKLIPDDATIERHARRSLERQLLEQAIAKIVDEITEQAKAAVLPSNLQEQIKMVLETDPTMPWDKAVAQIILSFSR